VFCHFAEILGAERDMKDVAAADCLGILTKALDMLSTELRGVLQYINSTEQIPATYEAVSSYLTKLPMVVDWMKRSVFHRGAAMAFAMELSHYLEDFELHLVVEGYCRDSGGISIQRVQELFATAAPYAEGVLMAGDLLPHLSSQVVPGKPEPKAREFPAEQPFWVVVVGGSPHLW
jgi:hypothetical protein